MAATPTGALDMTVLFQDATPGPPLVGLAYNKYVPELLNTHPDAADYIEAPYELFAHDSAVLDRLHDKPVILHCATLSVGGSVLCPERTVEDIGRWISRTETPWLGEHLAFITAERDAIGGKADEYAPGEPYNIGYTVSPAMNLEAVERVESRLAHYQSKLSIPMLLENSPLYFRLPNSTMTQAEFFNAICERSRVGLLLDLAHWYISSQTMEFDAELELEQLPLEKVVEIHVSGVDEQAGGLWDNHAERAPEAIFRLLEKTLELAPHARAVTMEYNWSSTFPTPVLLEEVARMRASLRRAYQL